MKAIFLNLIGIAMILGAGASSAQYPDMTEEEMAELLGYTEMVPTEEDINFAATPSACEPGDTTCEELYLDTYGEHFHGYMQAQQHPSPINTWKEGQCILGENCDTLQSEWEAWVNSANSGALDFSQGECINPPEGEDRWFGLDPAYKCYEYK